MKDKKGRRSKAESRKLRQRKKGEAQKQKSVRFASSINIASNKTLKIAPIPDLLGRDVKIRQSPEPQKIVYVPNTEEFSNECSLTWCSSRTDVDGHWSWGEPRQWSVEEWEQEIIPSFRVLEVLTWNEILNEQKVPVKGGKLVPRHHFQEIDSLDKEAQKRWFAIGLEEYDTAFRFRFGGRVRAWGIKLKGHFYLIWWERYHRIYQVSKS